MKRLALLAAMAVCAVLVRSARASDVLDVSDIVTFEGQDNGGAANVNIRQYSSLVPTGGGEFVIGAGDCTSDHGVVLKDKHPNCYYRQFSGPVHLKWYGVTSMADSGAPDVTTQLKYAIAIAAAVNPVPNANAASGVVDTDGMRIHVSDNGNTTGHAIDILKDVRLTCDAPPGGTRKMMRTPDYTATPATIVLIPNGTSPVGSIFPADNAGFDHCIVLTTGSSAYPIILNPASTLDAMQDLRNMIANAGTAVDCYNIASCNVHDNLIIGFDTAIEVNMSSHAKIDNNTVDADVGIFLTTLGSSAVINGFEMDSFLTTGFDKTFNNDELTVTEATDGACQVSGFLSADFPNFAVGDPVDVTGAVDITTGANLLNCNGLWSVGTIDLIHQTIELARSHFAPPAPTGSWLQNSQVIYVSSVTGVWPGETVSCGGCGSGTTVVDVSTYTPLSAMACGTTTCRYAVIISQAATDTDTGTVHFVGPEGSANATVYLYPSLRPWAGQSDGGKGTYIPEYKPDTVTGSGTCIQAGTDTDGMNGGIGVKAVDANCFGHEVAYAWPGAGPGGCVDCSSDSHAEIEDLGRIALLVRGEKTGYLGFSGMSQAASGGMVIDLTADHCVGVSNAQFDPNTNGTIAVHAVNGCFTLSGVRANSRGAADWLLETGAASAVNGTITGSNSSYTTLYYENPALAAATSCANNLFATQTCGNSLPTNVVSTGTAPVCGSGCSVVSGTNNAMSVTSDGSVMSETVSFANMGFTNAPTCVVMPGTPGAPGATIATTPADLTISFPSSVSGVAEYVVCIGH